MIDENEMHMNTIISDVEYYYSKYLESTTILQEFEISYYEGDPDE